MLQRRGGEVGRWRGVGGGKRLLRGSKNKRKEEEEESGCRVACWWRSSKSSQQLLPAVWRTRMQFLFVSCVRLLSTTETTTPLTLTI
ncbi:hypothetical protein T09_15250 [Trichinella sp. T9]|nr:hypothetical protein T09_15250 [Trichinella sp. T9]